MYWMKNDDLVTDAAVDIDVTDDRRRKRRKRCNRYRCNRRNRPCIGCRMWCCLTDQTGVTDAADLLDDTDVLNITYYLMARTRAV